MNRRESFLWGVVGFIIVSVVAYLAFILHSFREGNYGQNEAMVYASLGSGLATVALVLVIYLQSLQNEKLIEQTSRQSLIVQESEWIPEVRQPLQEQILAFSNHRPWYPWFKIQSEGKSSDWYEEWVRRVLDEHSLDDAIDWFTPIPEKIRDFLNKELDPGVHEGDLILRFETMTGEDYFFIYHLEFLISPERFIIRETPSVERLLPWDDSARRQELLSEFEESTGYRDILGEV